MESVKSEIKVGQRREPLISSPLPERPWDRIGTDLLDFKGKTFLVVMDHNSCYSEVVDLSKATPSLAIAKLKSIFARWGIPLEVVSDNGPQFSSESFSNLANGFKHTTSSPYYPQSNGLAESAVKIAKITARRSVSCSDDFKIAIISPIHKSGSKTNCDNYRPISVLSSVAKIFERLITEQLETYLESNSILVEQQAGFRKKHSTQTSLLNITNQWLMNMDKGCLNGVIFLDLKKAFDCVDHDVLVKKMYYYGVRGLALKLFQSYLTNRTQICKVNQTMSNTRIVKCGIPQGSNLGPLLFLLYINDLPNCLTSSSTSMFADDTNISTQGTTEYEIQERLNADLENVHQWLVANKLTLNKQKTEYMIIGSRQRISNIITDPKIELGESVIKRVNKSKTLGIIIDEHLSWNDQIQNVVTKVSKGIGMLRRIRQFVPKSTLLRICNAIVLSHFDYCSLVWDNCCEYLTDKLQKLQNRAARIITGRTYDVSSDDVLKELNWEPLKQRYKINKTIFMHKVRNDIIPSSLTNLFKIKTNDRYDLRSNNNNYVLGKPKTNFMKKSFAYSAASLWNGLSSTAKEKGISLNKFKCTLGST